MDDCIGGNRGFPRYTVIPIMLTLNRSNWSSSPSGRRPCSQSREPNRWVLDYLQLACGMWTGGSDKAIENRSLLIVLSLKDKMFTRITQRIVFKPKLGIEK